MIGKGVLDAVSQRELERHNTALVPGFVLGWWHGKASELPQQKKRIYLTFASLFWKPDARFDGLWG